MGTAKVMRVLRRLVRPGAAQQRGGGAADVVVGTAQVIPVAIALTLSVATGLQGAALMGALHPAAGALGGAGPEMLAPDVAAGVREMLMEYVLLVWPPGAAALVRVAMLAAALSLRARSISRATLGALLRLHAQLREERYRTGQVLRNVDPRRRRRTRARSSS